jgi:hypothetical protein
MKNKCTDPDGRGMNMTMFANHVDTDYSVGMDMGVYILGDHFYMETDADVDTKDLLSTSLNFKTESFQDSSSPTNRPSSAPTNRPSSAPTSRPTSQTRTSLSFNTVVKVDGVDASMFLNNSLYTVAYIDAMAAASNISAADITVTNVIDSNSRRFLRETVSRDLLASSVLVTTLIKVIIEDSDLVSNDGMQLYEVLKTAIVTSTSSGTFGKKLATETAKHSLPAAITVDDAYVVMVDDPVIEEERTVTPSQSPTSAPDDDDALSLFGLSSDESIGVLVVFAIGGLVFFVLIAFLVLRLCNASSPDDPATYQTVDPSIEKPRQDDAQAKAAGRTLVSVGPDTVTANEPDNEANL